MKEKKPFKMPDIPQSLNDIELPLNVIRLVRRENDLQMRLHNILARVKHALDKPLPPYPEDQKD